MKAKTFDCVRMKRVGAAKIRQKTKGLTVKEEAEFWQKKTAALRRRQRAVRARCRAAR